jgi:hypothetical protein
MRNPVIASSPKGNAAIQITTTDMRRRHRFSGLLRCARNDGGKAACLIPSLRGAEGDVAIQIKTNNMRRRHRCARNEGERIS